MFKGISFLFNGSGGTDVRLAAVVLDTSYHIGRPLHLTVCPFLLMFNYPFYIRNMFKNLCLSGCDLIVPMTSVHELACANLASGVLAASPESSSIFWYPAVPRPVPV